MLKKVETNIEFEKFMEIYRKGFPYDEYRYKNKATHRYFFREHNMNIGIIEFAPYIENKTILVHNFEQYEKLKENQHSIYIIDNLHIEKEHAHYSNILQIAKVVDLFGEEYNVSYFIAEINSVLCKILHKRHKIPMEMYSPEIRYLDKKETPIIVSQYELHKRMKHEKMKNVI